MSDYLRYVSDAMDLAHETGRKARQVWAAGRIAPEKEARLRKKVKQARYLFETYGGHGAEIELARAEQELEDYLTERKP